MPILRLIEYTDSKKTEVIDTKKYNKLIDKKVFFKVIRRWEI